MSLINQMLQDLEQRRASEAAGTQSPLHGTAASVSQKMSRNYTLLSLIMLSAVLATTTAWLALERHGSRAAPLIVGEGEQTISVMDSVQHVENQSAVMSAPDDTQDVAATNQAEQPIVSSTKHVESNQLTATEIKNTVEANNETIITASTAIRHKDRQPVSSNIRQTPATAHIDKKRLPLNPAQRAESDYQLALEKMSQGELHEAIALMQQALDQHATHHEARQTLSALLIQQGRVPEATILLEQGLGVAPLHSGFSQMYARILADQKQYGIALAVLERAQPGIGNDPQYHALMAALYQKSGNNKQAIKQYQALVEAIPNNSAWWLGLAISLDANHDYAKASSAFEKAASIGGLQPSIMQYIETRISQLRSAH